MTDQTSAGGSSGLAFIVGALVVCVAIIAFFTFGDRTGGDAEKDVNVKIEVPNPTGGSGEKKSQ